MKSVSIALVLISLFALITIDIQPIQGQIDIHFTINSDGRITPQTSLIKQTNNTYTLTGNLESSIVIQRSNIIFSGNGSYSINGYLQMDSVSNVTIENLLITYTSGVVVILSNVFNITIENNTITSSETPFGMIGEISVENSNSVSILKNTLQKGMFGILLTNTKNTLIAENNILSNSNSWGYYSAGVILYSSSNNSIYFNNFIDNEHGVQFDNSSINSWDNGKIGNYWSDYQSKYPNATETDDSGIGNIPYVTNINNTDNYPLLRQVNINSPIPTPAVPELSWSTILPIFAITLISAFLVRYRCGKRVVLNEKREA